jgi:hypothetical protein
VRVAALAVALLGGGAISGGGAHIACRERCLAAISWALFEANLGSSWAKKVAPLVLIAESWPALWGLLARPNKGGGPRVSSRVRMTIG